MHSGSDGVLQGYKVTHALFQDRISYCCQGYSIKRSAMYLFQCWKKAYRADLYKFPKSHASTAELKKAVLTMAALMSVEAEIAYTSQVGPPTVAQN